MHDYRVYLLNDDGRIVRAMWVQSDSLDQAMQRVAAEVPDHNCEIWEGQHCLAKVGAETRDLSLRGSSSAMPPSFFSTLG
jgi:hypothetical protein